MHGFHWENYIILTYLDLFDLCWHIFDSFSTTNVKLGHSELLDLINEF